MPFNVYLLQLDSHGLPPSGYICTPPPPFKLRIQSSLPGRFWINTPPSNEPFVRNRFYDYKLHSGFAASAEVDIKVTQAGAFTAYIEYEGESKPEETRQWHFCVQPALHVPINSVSMLTVISKLMGQLPWDHKFNEIRKRGYNMIHFTPLQKRGVSNSPYSLASHLEFDPFIFSSVSDVEEMIFKMSEIGLLSLTDVVWNHVANNASWLEEHPEAGYSVETSPHLTAAVELDSALLQFSRDLEKFALPTHLRTKEDLLRVMNGIKTQVVDQLKLWEFYVLDVEAVLAATHNHDGQVPAVVGKDLEEKSAWIRRTVESSLDSRYGKTPSLERTAAILRTEGEEGLKKVLDQVNLPLYRMYDEDTKEILNQLENRISYLRLDEQGPKLGIINDKNPLIETYFTRLDNGKALANNGWIWNADPLTDFASEKSRAYLRREVIIWEDCVKLRYGATPDANPWIWEYMGEYTKLMAKHFSGFRIDNCHSTPLHVAKYLLDLARSVRPNLYVVAELFTGSEQLDVVFVEELGICSLIREAMQAGSPGELSRLVHMHGGDPIGSFDQTSTSENGTIQLLRPCSVHALFADCTHDNEMPSQKRTSADTLSNAALVSMCNCAIGSIVGYDEVYPELLNVVKEAREYTLGGGIAQVRELLNDAHCIMGEKDAREMHVHHEGVWITVHRVKQGEGSGHLLLAKTAFGGDGPNLTPVVLRGTEASVEGAWALEVIGEAPAKNATKIEGIPTKLVELEPPIIVKGKDKQGEFVRIEVPNNFPPGSIALLKTKITGLNDNLDNFLTTEADGAFSQITLADLNCLLYSCDVEERDRSGGDGVYSVPGSGPLVYAGLEGFWSIFKGVIRDNDLGHAICQHLREGEWPLDYIVNRLTHWLKDNPSLRGPTEWLRARCDCIRKVPSFLLPRCFALVLRTAYHASRIRAANLFSPLIRNGDDFLQSLALVSIQMVSAVPSASLVPNEVLPSMAAGLPHFARDWARCWGRDVFISLRGLLLVTGRYEEAKKHILVFASVLRHGMIPNLLDAGRRPRYNSRDSVWFFLQTIQDYVSMAPDGHHLLQASVKRRFPLDDAFVEVDDPKAYAHTSTINDIIYEILRGHAQGIHFREYNAGPQLDSQMSDQGFNIDVQVDWSTGFVHGGNRFNCGTWMDKMGESEQAGSKGVPGTPRDGAAIEITGLLKSALRWVIELHAHGHFPWTEVNTTPGDNGQKVSFGEWEKKIQQNFERSYFIPQRPAEDGEYDVKSHLIHRRGFYKDLFKSWREVEDYQLRPNQFIAMTVAKELFIDQHARSALRTADQHLRGPVGMRTLDPNDPDYRPYYNNSEDSRDFATSKGRNYHQGPEWVWCVGYFLRAYLAFERRVSGKAAILRQISLRLENHRTWIQESPWAGLTELTNRDGEFCADSCPTQAWSAATLLDLFEEASHM